MIFLWLLLFHWIGDFVCQTHWMAINKSKSNLALGLHVLIYSIVLGIGAYMLTTNIPIALGFTFVNGVLHFITDYHTSRWTRRLWAKGEVHNFFVVIGLDQLIHQMCLCFTAMWLLLA